MATKTFSQYSVGIASEYQSTTKQTPTIRRTSTGRRLQAYSMYQYIITEY
jgi:hypothetical protein